MGTITAISQSDVNIIGSSLKSLSENMNNVTSEVVVINGQMKNFNKQVELITENVKSLEEEIRDFMYEIKGSSIVSNAQNEILLKENELNKKYSHYDVLRRKTNGILEGINMNSIKKNTLMVQSEQLILNAPNYYLSYALIALCSWALNNKDMATKALNKALALNPSKTLLLFSLVHLKLNRNNTALKWLKRYLSMQEPDNIDKEIVHVLDSLANNTFSNEMTTEIMTHITSWYNQLKTNEDINLHQIQRFESFFDNTREEISEKEYPYIVLHTDGWEEVSNKLSKSYCYYNAKKSFDQLITNSTNNKKEVMNNLIENLLFSYEGSELELRKEILKNKLIIDAKGNKEKAEKQFKDSALSLNDKNNFFTELTNIILERNDVSKETKKLAISYSKENIIKAFNKVLPEVDSSLGVINIKMNDWSATISDGSNEKELQQSLAEYVKKPFNTRISKSNIIDIKVVASIIAMLGGTVLSFYKLYLGIPTLILGAVLTFIFVNSNINKKNETLKEYNSVLKTYMFELNNVIAEIVDVNYIIKRNNKSKTELINYINSFNSENFISTQMKKEVPYE